LIDRKIDRKIARYIEKYWYIESKKETINGKTRKNDRNEGKKECTIHR